MSKRRAAFLTLGCKVNQYETDAMEEILEKAGYEIVSFKETADVYIINTCSVTNMADRKSRQMIHRAKKNNPDAIIVAAGCYVQAAEEELAKKNEADILVGNNKKKDIAQILEEYFAAKEPEQEVPVVSEVIDINHTKEYEDLIIHKVNEHTRAYIKIQEGCNRYCTYCIIPYARGPIRSRKPEEVIEEVKKLAENGFKEVVLTGIHVASYGLDLGNITLADIIEKVHSVNGIERIRFSSMEPLAIDDDFVARMAKLPKVCDHYHLSLQSGCNRTLKRMNRKYNAEQYAEACERLRNTFPNVAITTDIIVGFPDETEEDFKESLAFAEKMKLDKIHTFPYSPKKGTPAAKMKNQISGDVKSQRSKEMIALSDKMNIDFLNNNIGKTVPVLFEDMENGFWQGHTTNYIKVLVKSDENLNNKIVDVKLDKIHGVEIVEGTVVK